MAYKQKRKAGQSSKKVNQKSRRIDRKAAVPTDAISSLPDDCKLDVFKHLDLKSLQTMSTVSKSMCALARYHSAKTKNSREGELRIVEFGHAFHLSFGKEDPKYMYVHGFPNKAGAVKRSRIEYSGAFNEVKFGHLVLFRERSFTIMNSDGFYVPSNHTPVPEQLTINLNILLERHTFAALHLRFIRVDLTLLDYLEGVSKYVTRFVLNGLKVEDDCLERFTKFVSRSKLQHFEMHDCGYLCKNFMTAEFMMKFLKNCDTSAQNSLRFDSATHYVEAERFRFYPSSEIVDVLALFQVIEMTSLTVETVWIPALIEKRLKCKRAGIITISITHRPDVWNFEQFPHLTYQQIRKNKRRRRTFPQDIRWNLVEDAMSGMQASFYEYQQGNVFAFEAEFSKIEVIGQGK